MISANFYQPTTYYNNNLSGQSPDRNTLVNQNVWDGTDAQPYFLGWCKLPTALDVTRFKIESEGGATRFTAYGSDMDNVSYTYNVNYSTYFEGIGATYSFLPANNDATQGRNGHLPNKLQVGTLLTQSYCHIWALYRTSDTEEISGSWAAYEVANLGVTTEISDFNTLLGFLKGETTVQLAFRNPHNHAHAKTFELTGTDFEETGYYHHNGALDSGYGDIYLFITRFEAFTGRDYLIPFPEDPSQNLANTYTHAWGMIKTPWSLLTAYSSLGYLNSYAMYFDFRTNTMPWFQGIPVVGNIEEIYGYGMRFTIASNNPVLVSGNKDVFIDGNIIGVNAGTNYLQIFRMFTPTECLEVMAIQPRYIGGVPHIGEDGAPIIGEFTNDPDEMTPWQLGDITDSEYTDDDRPPYEPEPEPGGEPDEGDWGTSIIPFSQTTFGSTSFSRFELLNQAGVNELLGKLWAAPQSFWEGLSISKQLAANLSDYILSLRAYPVALNAPLDTHHTTIYIGASSGIDIQQGLYIPTLVNRIPLGALRISRQYSNFLDYNPYTAASIYLPFCGTVEINPKYLYDAALYLTLFVDCTDGSGVWVLVREGDDGKSFPILLRQCRVGVDIPITGLDTSQMASNIVNATIQTGQHALQTVNKVTGAAAQVGAAVATGGAIGAEGAANLATMGGSIALQGLADATNMAMANKEIPFYTSGSGGAAAAEGNTEPFVTLRRPLCTNPSNFAHTVGNLVNQTAVISSLDGFTICRNVDVNGIGQATDKEKAQIKQILESGFYA